MSNDAERLGEIEGRIAAATPGPWEVDEEDYGDESPWYVPCELVAPNADNRRIVAQQGGFAYDQNWTTIDQCRTDAAFIAASREDIPYLLSALRAAQEGNERLVKAIIPHWREVGARNNDMCGFCGATINAKTQERADGAGWDFIEHRSDCVVLLVPKEQR